MFQPYPYQIECLGEIDKARREARKSGLVVMASGLGKTVTAGLAAKQWLEEKRGRLLYICHQNDILEQAKSTFEAILGHEYTYGFLHGERKTLREVHCLFASFQTMLGFKEYFEPNEFTYVIVDETHHSHAVTYLETLRYFTPEFLLGITATPDRTDKKNIREIYGNEIYSLPLEEALARNLLTPVDYRLLTDEIQLAGIIDTPAGKMSINQLNKKIFVPKRDDEISEIIAKHISECANPRIIVFCSSIFHCNHIAEFLPQSMAIHSRVPTKERALRLELFRQGIIGTVVTVDCFNEGIDIPQANIIVFLRSTSSPTLFLQQLGRGLRKSDGKDRVVVLDFVANCERIKVVYNLWRSVEEKRSVLDKIGTGTAIDSPSPMMVDVHKVKFDETAIKIIDVIEKIRRGYSKGVLIEQLQALAKELGRTPRVQDVAGASKMGKTASIGKFAAEFGSFAKALNAAGYKSDWTYEYTTESLIDQLKILSVELGRSPTVAEVALESRTDRCAHPATLKRAFGSFGAALEAAGLKTRRKRFSREELISQLQSLRKKLGRTPKFNELNELRELRKEMGCASLHQFRKTFGSFNRALRAAGMPTTFDRPAKDELIQSLQRFGRKLGKTPTIDDISKTSRAECASITRFRKIFGTFNAALEAAGFEVNHGTYSRNDLIAQLQDLREKLGHVPTRKEIVEEHCASLPTFRKAFGSFNNALRAAGLTVGRERKPAAGEVTAG